MFVRTVFVEIRRISLSKSCYMSLRQHSRWLNNSKIINSKITMNHSNTTCLLLNSKKIVNKNQTIFKLLSILMILVNQNNITITEQTMNLDDLLMFFYSLQIWLSNSTHKQIDFLLLLNFKCNFLSLKIELLSNLILKF